MAKQSKNKVNFLGVYSTEKNESVVGELKLRGAKTLLSLHSDNDMVDFEKASTIQGLAYSGEHLTLIDCRRAGSTRNVFPDGRQTYNDNIFPHFVIKGGEFLDPDGECISAIHFTTDDLFRVFHDYDAFGTVFDASKIIDAVLEVKSSERAVEVGEYPHVFYYTGKSCMTDVSTVIGRVSVHHRPSFGLGGSEGVALENKIVVSIETLAAPVSLEVAMANVYKVANFLSVLAGRVQSIKGLQVTTTNNVNDIPVVLDVFESYRLKGRDKSEHNRPVVGDIPLDPIRRRAEFEDVLCNWIEKHDKWRLARNRSLNCLGKANKYSPDRLVAAANMFDILPPDAVPLKVESEAAFLQTVSEFKAKLKGHLESIDRNSILNALGRIGKPSLPKKVSHRVAIIDQSIGSVFPELEFVANVAVKCRNYYVHGSSGDLDFEKVEPFIPFLTDALEFVFSASDLIDSGWDAKSWSANHYGWGHSYTRFRAEYLVGVQQLRDAVKKKSA